MPTLPDTDKALITLSGEIKTPPFSSAARVEAGVLLRKLQKGLPLTMPQARPMPSIGPRCLELRIIDENVTWRIICRTDDDAVLMLHVFPKKTQTTPQTVITVCKQRLRAYDQAVKGV